MSRPDFKELKASPVLFPLETLVVHANALLPRYLPAEKASDKVRDEVNARLVRHYTTAGLIDEPAKEGREARYGFRHLLQVLVVRRLLQEGCASAAVFRLTSGRSNEELENLLDSGLTPSDSNPATEFLRGLRPQLSGNRANQRSNTRPRTDPSASAWERHPVTPGVELHLRADLARPMDTGTLNKVLEQISALLRRPR
jgi:DNA-binding transcriptional MerR regulator